MLARHKTPRSSVSTAAIFVAGTDTGIGKTVVTAAILSILRASGVDAVPMKPVQTGCVVRRGTIVAPDIEFCLSANGLDPDATDLENMSPYKFRPACSPHLAVRLANSSISTGTISRRFSALQAKHEFVVAEGAGGILVPIGAGRTMLDIILKLAAPVVLVARPGLGTINHSLLSLRVLRDAGVEVIGVVFNHALPGRPSRIEKDNVSAVADHGNVRVLGSLPFAHDMGKLKRSPENFRRWASAHLSLPAPDFLKSRNEVTT